MAVWRPVELRWDQDEFRCTLGGEAMSRGVLLAWVALGLATAGMLGTLAMLGEAGLIVGLLVGPGLLIGGGFAVGRALSPGGMGPTELILGPTSLTLIGPAVPGTLQVPASEVSEAELRVAPYPVLRLVIRGDVIAIPVDDFDPAEIDRLATRIRTTADQHRAFLSDDHRAGRDHARELAAVLREAERTGS